MAQTAEVKKVYGKIIFCNAPLKPFIGEQKKEEKKKEEKKEEKKKKKLIH